MPGWQGKDMLGAWLESLRGAVRNRRVHLADLRSAVAVEEQRIWLSVDLLAQQERGALLNRSSSALVRSGSGSHSPT